MINLYRTTSEIAEVLGRVSRQIAIEQTLGQKKTINITRYGERKYEEGIFDIAITSVITIYILT